jgi:hypothetical protein
MVDRNSTRKSPAKAMLRTARWNAKRRGLEFAITLADIVIPAVCPVLKIPILFDGGRNNMPSLDRIDSNLGYVKGNVVVISWRANWLKSNATNEELELLGKFYSDLSRRVRSKRSGE